MVRSALALLVVGAKMSAEPAEEPVAIDSAGVIEWQAPPGCPHRSDVEARLTKFLGDRAPTNTRDGGFRAVGVVDERDESGEYVLKLQIFANDAVDQRTIAGPQCDELAQAFALVVAVTVEPIAVAATVHAKAPKQVPKPPEPVELPDELEPLVTGDVAHQGRSSTAADRTIIAPDRRRNPLAAVPYGQAAVAYGPVRAPTVAIGGGLGVLVARVFRVEFGAQHRFGSVVGAEVSTRITTTTAIATGCGIPKMKTVEFPICLGLELGSIRASDTQGLAETLAVRSLWSAAVVGARIMWPWRPWLALGAHASGFVSYTPVVFGVDGDNRTVFRSEPVGALFGLAIEARIPVTKSRRPGQ